MAAERLTSEQPPLFQRGKERLTNPDLALIQVTEIHGVPGVKYDIAVVRDPYHSALGGWRIKPAEILLTDYRKNPDYAEKIVEGRSDIPDDELAKAGILESFQLAGEMSLKWAGMRSTIRYGIDAHSYIYYSHRDKMVDMRDAWIDASRMDGGTKGILAVTDPEAYKAITPEQRESLLEQHAKHMIALNDRKPAGAAADVAYYTAPDMGSTEEMMDTIRKHTEGRFVACYSPNKGGTGNPSPTTALGVAWGSEAATTLLGMHEHGRRPIFAVQGAAGEVGSALVGFLKEKHRGASIFIADVDSDRKKQEKLSLLRKNEGVTIVDQEEIFSIGNIFVPSGPAGQLNERTLDLMMGKVDAVVGPANYLWTAGKDDDLAEAFRAENILVAPAPLVNQGGIRSILPQFIEQNTGERPSSDVAHKSVADVKPMTLFVLDEAISRQVTPDQVFQEIAYEEYAKQCQAKGLI